MPRSSRTRAARCRGSPRLVREKEKRFDAQSYVDVIRRLKRDAIPIRLNSWAPYNRGQSPARGRDPPRGDYRVALAGAGPMVMRLATAAESAAAALQPHMGAAPTLIGNTGRARGQFVLPLANPSVRAPRKCIETTSTSRRSPRDPVERTRRAPRGHELQFSAMIEGGVPLAAEPLRPSTAVNDRGLGALMPKPRGALTYRTTQKDNVIALQAMRSCVPRARCVIPMLHYGSPSHPRSAREPACSSTSFCRPPVTPPGELIAIQFSGARGPSWELLLRVHTSPASCGRTTELATRGPLRSHGIQRFSARAGSAAAGPASAEGLREEFQSCRRKLARPSTTRGPAGFRWATGRAGCHARRPQHSQRASDHRIPPAIGH
jgi:hypothetical protein